MAKKPFSAPVTRRTVLATGIAAIPVAIGLVNVPARRHPRPIRAGS